MMSVDKYWIPCTNKQINNKKNNHKIQRQKNKKFPKQMKMSLAFLRSLFQFIKRKALQQKPYTEIDYFSFNKYRVENALQTTALKLVILVENSHQNESASSMMVEWYGGNILVKHVRLILILGPFSKDLVEFPDEATLLLIINVQHDRL